MNDTYIFEQFHFHWGHLDGDVGSEHTIDDTSYPAEIHFVHFNSKYGNIGDSLGYSDGLAVVGFMFEVTNSRRAVTTDYMQILNKISKIENGADIGEQEINFATLFDKDPKQGTGQFYRYDGSLTTPPCLEIVTWTLFDVPIKIAKSTLNKFSKATEVLNGEIVTMEDNFRPVQPLFNRTVRTNFVPSAPSVENRIVKKVRVKSSAAIATGSTLALSVLLFISSIFM